MKKIFVFLIGISMLFLSGCGRTSYDEISYNELQSMIENKESFPLVIASATCSACNSYRPTLEKFIKEYNVDVKYIDLDKLTDEEESDLMNEFPITGTPTTIFVKNGEEKDTYNRIVGNKKFSQTEEAYKDNGYID